MPQNTPLIAPRVFVCLVFLLFLLSGTASAASQSTLLRLEKFYNRPVQTAEGKVVGELSGVLIDPETGALSCAIVSQEGFLGLVNPKRIVAWKFMDFNKENGVFTLRKNKKISWDDVPEFVGKLNGVQSDGDIERLYSLLGAGPYKKEAAKVRDAVIKRHKPEHRKYPAKRFNGVMEGSRILNRDVLDFNDNVLGEIEAVYCDVDGKEVSHIALEIRESDADDLKILKMSDMQFVWEDRRVKIVLHRDLFKGAPVMTRGSDALTAGVFPQK